MGPARESTLVEKVEMYCTTLSVAAQCDAIFDLTHFKRSHMCMTKLAKELHGEVQHLNMHQPTSVRQLTRHLLSHVHTRNVVHTHVNIFGLIRINSNELCCAT